MTIEDLERGMKLLWDEHVYPAGRPGRIEKIQERTPQEIGSLFQGISQMHETLGVMKDVEISVMKTTTTLANRASDLTNTVSELAYRVNDLTDVVGNLAEAQKRTDATVAALAEDLQILTRRADTFIAGLRNGRETREWPGSELLTRLQ